MIVYQVNQSFEADECRTIEYGLQDFMRDQLDRETKPLNIFMYDEDHFIGGALGVIVAQRLNVAAVWIDKTYRRQKLGSAVLDRLETAGRAAGCTHALVDTMAFQAPDFYKKQGYIEIARLTNVYDHDRIFLRKELV